MLRALTTISACCILLISLLSCGGEVNNSATAPTAEKDDFGPLVHTDNLKATTMVPSPDNKFEKGKNVIYATAFLYAWDEIRRNSKGPLKIDEPATTDLGLVNSSTAHENTLLKGEYTSSYVQGIDGLVAEAYFKKLLPFKDKFRKSTTHLKFKGTNVANFEMSHYDDEDIKKQLSILYYKDDGDFIIRLQPKDVEHEIILIMQPNYANTFSAIIAEVNKLIAKGNKESSVAENSSLYTFNYEDYFCMPVIDFNVETNYTGIEGRKVFTNGRWFTMMTASQRTALVLNEEGAKVESEAHIAADSAGKVVIKKLVFNKPFVVMLKRKNAPNPYFALLVDNAELLVPFK
jgi:hypothetical protein